MKKLCIAALLLSFSSPSFAADVTTLQAALEAARQNMEGAQSKYLDAQRQFSYQKNVVARIRAKLEREQQQLSADRKLLDETQKSYYSAKEKHDRAQAVLDKAWNNH